MTKEEFLASKDKCFVCGLYVPEFNLGIDGTVDHYRLFFRMDKTVDNQLWRSIFFHKECFAEVAGTEFTLDFTE